MIDPEDYILDEPEDTGQGYQTISLRQVILGLNPYILIELDAAGNDADIKMGGNVSELLHLADNLPRIRKGLKKELKKQQKEGK